LAYRQGIRRVGSFDEQAADVEALAQFVATVGVAQPEADGVWTLRASVRSE
jgi:hypothetical protein